MNSPSRFLLILLLAWIPIALVAQDLKKATIDYFTEQHYTYDPAVIRGSKIKSIEKYRWRYEGKKAVQGILLEKHLFNEQGQPEYFYLKPAFSDPKQVFFCYDSRGNLIRKEHFAHAPGLRYQNHDTYEWNYNEAGFLTRQRRYMIVDKIPTKDGAHGFPETHMLYSNDSISYHSEDGTVYIVSNDRDHCTDMPEPGVIPNIYPPNFEAVTETSIQFHPSNKTQSKTTRRDSIVRTESFEQCGNPVRTEKSPKYLWMEQVLGRSIDCQEPEQMNILEGITDTTRLRCQLVFYRDYKFGHTTHRAMAPIFTHTEEMSYYNLELRKVYSEIATASRSDYPPMDTKRFDHQHFVYLKNGLLHQIVTRDENGKLREITEFRMKYYK